MRQNLALLLFGLLSTLTTTAQKRYKRAIDFTTDNDTYFPFMGRDRYYSFGFDLGYTFQKEQFLGLQSVFKNKQTTLYHADIHMEAYTPANAGTFIVTDKIEDNDDFDRPFAGLIYGTFGASHIFERSFVRTELLIGSIGPRTGVGNIQIWFHENFFNFDIYVGWEFQVPNQWFVNLNTEWIQEFKNTDSSAIFIGSDLKIGTLYINAYPRIGFRLGKFGAVTESVAFGNFLLLPQKQKELFWQTSIGPQLHIHDATIRGNLFKDDLFKDNLLNPVTLKGESGVYYANDWYSASFSLNYNSPILEGMTHHFYGSIKLGMRI